MTYAKIILDSITTKGDRLTTMEVEMHRFVLPEFNTHRMFSRNSASSRAIPISKQIRMVRHDPATPILWGRNQPGMQAGDEIDDPDTAEKIWLKASKSAVKQAEKLERMGVHKQVVNRLLEPFMWHKVIVTATSWDGFFEQRCSPLAQPEIRAVADEMKLAMDNSEPQNIYAGEFHLPYLLDEEKYLDTRSKIKISIARCARVSYLNHDGAVDIQKDFDLFEKLATAEPPHWSPMEHVATPAGLGLDLSGNLDGYAQIRHNLNLVR